MIFQATVSFHRRSDATAQSSKKFNTLQEFLINFQFRFGPLFSIKRNISPVLPSSPIPVPSNVNAVMPFVATPIAIGNVSSTNGVCKIDQNVVSTQNYEMEDPSTIFITKDSTPHHLTQWLASHRLSAYTSTFSHFSGCDLLRFVRRER